MSWHYFLFSLFVALWGIGFSIEISEQASKNVALQAARIANVSAAIFTVLWFHFALIYTNRIERHKSTLIFLYAVLFFVCCAGFTKYFIPSVRPILDFANYANPGPAYHLLTLLYFLVVPFGFVQLFHKFRNETGAKRTETLGFIVATMSGFIGGGFLFLPVYEILIPQHGIFLLPVYPFIMAYFMMRKNLFSLADLADAVHRDKLAAIGTIAASMNHEIRNPLYVIQGLANVYTSNLNDGVYKSKEEALQKAHEVLKKTEEQATRAMDIMKRFSLFAKRSVDEVTQIQTIDLNQAMDDVLLLVGHELVLDQIEFQRDIPKSLTLRSDARHLEEILFNLIVNACQAIKATSRQETGRIQISAECINGHVNLIIKDNGHGIAEKQLSRIFEPFYTTKEEGTGLGLYVTKRLIETNQGRIRVQSVLGNGTEFRLEFNR